VSDPADFHPLWLGAGPIVLASGSRTRLALLEDAGIPVEVVKPAVDERAISDPLETAGIAPAVIARRLAAAKALAVAAQGNRFILAADQTLACERRLLHKPADRAAAADQIAFLSGRMHSLHAAVAIAVDGRIVARALGTARLRMRQLSPAMIERYLDAAGPAVTESVGGYQLERAGIHLFAQISGDHSTILGLPMMQTLRMLRRLRLVAE
jgi:septum formation protein